MVTERVICSAADRVLVHESVRDQFVDELVDITASMSIGPGREEPDVGPVVSQDHLEKITGYIERGREEGATLEIGGETLKRDGYFVEPTVFTDVEPDMTIAREEIFGPLLSVLSFADEAEAIELANDSDYGLTPGVFTTDLTRTHCLTRDLEAGNVYVNQWFGDTHQTPFGGYKQSGIGREKGLKALDSYLRMKNVTIDLE